MKYNEIENLVSNFDEFYENEELDIELFDDILLMDDKLIPKERVESFKELLSSLKIENNELIDINWYSIDAARILASWGYKEGVDYLKEIVEYGLKNIKTLAPHRLYGYDQTYEEILASLINYTIRLDGKGKKTEGLQEVSPILKKVISRAKEEFISLSEFIYDMDDDDFYVVFNESLKDTLEYLKNKKNKTFLDEYNIDDITKALTRPNILEEVEKMETKEELINRIKEGEAFSYLYFWGHHQKDKNIFDKSCFSQWFPSKFMLDGYKYPTAEHYMMAQKAKLFKDMEIFKKIIETKTPKEAKELGRQVKNFDNDIWSEKAFEIVVKGNLAKFSQNESLKKVLLDSAHKVLVEASPFDKIWGIGLSQDNISSSNPLEWEGQNYLGFALMKVREVISKKEKKCPQHQN